VLIRYKISVIIVIIGIVLSAYLTLYVMGYGGIMQIRNADSASDITLGVLRIVFCELGLIPLFISSAVVSVINNE